MSFSINQCRAINYDKMVIMSGCPLQKLIHFRRAQQAARIHSGFTCRKYIQVLDCRMLDVTVNGKYSPLDLLKLLLAGRAIGVNSSMYFEDTDFLQHLSKPKVVVDFQALMQ